MEVESEGVSDVDGAVANQQEQIVTWRDNKGWLRFAEPERQNRVDSILRDGQPVHIAIAP